MDSKVNRPSKIFIIVHFVAYFVIRPSFHRQPSKQWVPSSMMHIWFYLKNKRRLRSIKRACNTYRVSRKVLDSQNTKIRKVTLLLKKSYFKSEIPFGSKFILNQKSIWNHFRSQTCLDILFVHHPVLSNIKCSCISLQIVFPLYPSQTHTRKKSWV